MKYSASYLTEHPYVRSILNDRSWIKQIVTFKLPWPIGSRAINFHKLIFIKLLLKQVPPFATKWLISCFFLSSLIITITILVRPFSVEYYTRCSFVFFFLSFVFNEQTERVRERYRYELKTFVRVSRIRANRTKEWYGCVYGCELLKKWQLRQYTLL